MSSPHDHADGPTGAPRKTLAQQQAELRATLYEFMTGPRMQALLEAVYERAARGHMPSMKLLLQYGMPLLKQHRPGSAPRVGPSADLHNF